MKQMSGKSQQLFGAALLVVIFLTVGAKSALAVLPKDLKANEPYFKILEISPTNDEAVVKRAFRKLAKDFHTDTNGDTFNNNARSQEISEAYSILKSQFRAAKYESKAPQSAPPVVVQEFTDSVQTSGVAQQPRGEAPAGLEQLKGKDIDQIALWLLRQNSKAVTLEYVDNVRSYYFPQVSRKDLLVRLMHWANTDRTLPNAALGNEAMNVLYKMRMADKYNQTPKSCDDKMKPKSWTS